MFERCILLRSLAHSLSNNVTDFELITFIKFILVKWVFIIIYYISNPSYYITDYFHTQVGPTDEPDVNISSSKPKGSNC